MSRCGKCGAALPSGAISCNQCGEKIVRAKRCSGCGKVLLKGETVCSFCGTSADAAVYTVSAGPYIPPAVRKPVVPIAPAASPAESKHITSLIQPASATPPAAEKKRNRSGLFLAFGALLLLLLFVLYLLLPASPVLPAAADPSAQPLTVPAEPTAAPILTPTPESAFVPGPVSVPEVVSATEPISTSEPAPEPTPAPVPLPLPENGEVLLGAGQECISQLTIDCTKTTNNVYVKLKDSAGNSVFGFFVRAGQQAEVPVPGESYYVYFAHGTTWYGVDDLFGEDTYCAKDDEANDFSQYVATYTMYPVEGGQFQETPIDVEEF